MPFAGSAADAVQALSALERIKRRAGDELILVDNTRDHVAAGLAEGHRGVRLLDAPAQQSSYYARNVGAAAAANQWLLFLDADCLPDPAIIAAYFAQQIAAEDGALAGEVVADCGAGLVSRYQLDRGYLDQRANLNDRRSPYAVTANLLVRARALASIGGFQEGIRSAGDTELSWRLQQAGWRLGYRPQARVAHRHRERLLALARLQLRYGAGRAWLRRRYPSLGPPASSGSALRALAAAARWMIARQPDRAAFRLLDSLVIVLGRVGALLPNASAQPSRSMPPVRLVAIVDRFAELSESFIGLELESLGRAGWPARVESARRAERQELLVARTHPVDYWEDATPPAKLAALARLVGRHPLRCARDLLGRNRWRSQEPVVPLRILAPAAVRLIRGGESHLHAHFATGAALSALRFHRLTGISYSVTAHGYDIFREPANLREKLEQAAFATSGCAYNAEQLRALAPNARVHEIVMGVDPDRFHRTFPYPGARRLVAVGRLVEKKGFRYLLEAVAILEGAGVALDELTLVGDGPLRVSLAGLVRQLALTTPVRFCGALPHEQVRAAIERADLLVMPCVVASDGDRDSMPVAVKEAMALELPVLASAEVGLPELIPPQCGRLVPPGDAPALAVAIEELLSLPASERLEMGRAGRVHVLAHCNPDREAAKLIELICAHSTSMRCSTEARSMAASSTRSSSG